MEVKQRTHLTPEEVQEFLSYGVDFGETSCAYNLYEDGYASLALRGYGLGKIVKIIPAPNLQEVLKVLPKNIKMGDEDFMLNISFAPHSWYFNYRSWIDTSEYKYADYITDEDPLNAAVSLLRWVCENYPETLTKKE